MLKQLQRVYKANECLDLQDVQNAMKSVFDLINEFGPKYKLLIRLASLERRKQKLILISTK
ncbi:hypothetical protein DTQ70_07115 [Runella sp. SP2]|nr:hypothetical protein DTQ70_07115 [Runella sp. SP2]